MIEGQKTLYSLTSSNTLSKLFENQNIEDPCKRWFKEFTNILHRSFKKVRINGTKKENDVVLQKLKVKQEIMEKINLFRLRLVEKEVVSEEEYSKYFELIDALENVNMNIAEKTAHKKCMY